MQSMSYARVVLAASFVASAALALSPSRAQAAERGCSNWVPYAKRSCLAVDDSDKLTASVEVGSGGRGWYGYIELRGPDGTLAQSDVTRVGAPGQLSIDWQPAHGHAAAAGQYCTIDWRWDPYRRTYFQESSYCIDLP